VKSSAQKTAQAIFTDLDKHYVNGHSCYYEMMKFEYLRIKAKYLGKSKELVKNGNK